MESFSYIVLKVKYGEIIRRFCGRVLDNNKLDLGINGLREKIRNLFDFYSDTDFTMTYIDEDGDRVTLVNDDDLHDMMSQQLRPLRMNVDLRNEKINQFHDRLDGSSTSQMPPARSRTGGSEALKSLPEAEAETLSEFLLDAASKAKVVSHAHSEFSKILVWLAKALRNSHVQSSSVPETSTQKVATASSMADPSSSFYKDSKILNYGSATKPKTNTQNVATASSMADPSSSFYKDSKMLNYGSATKPKTNTQNVATASSMADPSSSFYKDGKILNRGSATKNIGGYVPAPVDLNPLPRDSFASRLMCNEPYFSPATHLDDDIIDESFFRWRHSLSGVPPMGTGPSMLGTVGAYPEIYSGGYVETFHKGVMCVGCGARPIMGPRFKSQVKDNYDLCAICFAEMGNDSEYIRIDYPASCWYPRMQAFNHRHSFADPQIIDNTLRSSGKQTKLDGCFVADVNVLDGTVMPPLNPFTKIWRLRNTGSSNWPHGTKLEWVKGVKFGSSASIEIEVPAHGLPVGQEIDVAVKFISPPLSGRFPSYWMLASPSGQRFGEHIWVIIQVVTALERPDANFFQALDLNLPPTEISSGDLNGHGDVENNSTPAVSDGLFFHPPDLSSIPKPVKLDHNLPVNGTEQRSVVNDKSPAASIDNHGYRPSSTTKLPSVTCPLVDFEPIPAALPPKVSVSSSSSEKVSSKNHHNVEEILLRALVDMGFKQMDLNKEVLKITGYDLEKAVDELCGVTEWDPMIQELEEMGFDDKHMNRTLLMKNNGSMKQVVMELGLS